MNLNYDIVRELIEYNCDGVDKYIHNNSTWLIFTDDKKWVIELTKDGTLWYNYNFFKDVFKYLSLDVVENQNYITKWVEETIITGVNYTGSNTRDESHQVEDTIQNGVKNTSPTFTKFMSGVEETIQNGVKETIYRQMGVVPVVENTIINGVKHTEYGDWLDGDERFDDIIQNGVKHTEKSLQIDGSCVVEDVIQNGIKETHDDVYHHKGRVGGVIKNGVKEVKPSYIMKYNPMNFEPVISEEKRIDDVTGVIRDGIKEVQPLPAQDGNRDWGNYYHRQEDRTKPFTKTVDDVIRDGIKETKPMEEWVNTTNIVGKVIDNGIKE